MPSFRPAIIIATIEVFLIFLVLYFTEKLVAVYLSEFLLLLTAVSFLKFLFAVIENRTNRAPLAVYTFVVVNIFSIIILFANVYKWLGIKDTVKTSSSPTSLMDALYFSVVTWTTLGYGDVVPCPAARPIAAIEALAGYVVMGLLIAVLVATVQSE